MTQYIDKDALVAGINQEWSAEDERNLNVVLSFIDDEYLRRWLKDVVHKRYD